MTSRIPRSLVLLLLLLAPHHTARAEPPPAPGYPWLAGRAIAEDLAHRVAPPAGATRVPVAPGSFGAWLRHLPLLPAGAPVHLFDGQLKARQDVHAAVVDLDVGRRDLQQCADAVMRLRAEYLWATGRFEDIRFHPDPGQSRTLAWTGGHDRAQFARYLVRVFADAGSASLQAELTPRGRAPLQPGDVLIQGGYPGHAVLVLDVATTADGRRLLLLGQSYLPAQEFHLLKNLADPGLSPWFDAAALARPEGLQTPEWRPFHAGDVRHFPD
ncbi:MAG TPA: DUF4846 domain-containing protein [Polyangia bacterium]|nr:DUF4846 domain-containing protein [Polyangia bacterium]